MLHTYLTTSHTSHTTKRDKFCMMTLTHKEEKPPEHRIASQKDPITQSTPKCFLRRQQQAGGHVGQSCKYCIRTTIQRIQIFCC